MNWSMRQDCLHCAECVISKTDGLCPIRLCAKNIVSGPCGGAINGKCEVNHSASCVWNAIFMRSAKKNTLEYLPQFFKDYTRHGFIRHEGKSNVV